MGVFFYQIDIHYFIYRLDWGDFFLMDIMDSVLKV